jgi:hypothetical protein
MEFNWQSYCSECNNSCCKGENPFDTNKIIKSKENGDCEFLCGKCLSYETRPFECRIFPLDILDIDNESY